MPLPSDQTAEDIPEKKEPWKPIYKNPDKPPAVQKPVYYYPVVRRPGQKTEDLPQPTWPRLQSLIKRGTYNGVDNPAANLSYWEYPATVVKYNNLIRTAPPDWKPPDWMDTTAIRDAYDYMKFKNENKPWQEWKALNPADAGVDFLKGIKTPPTDALWPSEAQFAVKTDQQVAQQQPYGDWDNLKTWQKLALGFAAPQTPDITDRPDWTRFTAALGQSALAGVGIGLGVGTFTSPVGGLIAGLAATGLLTYQSYTGNEVPLLNEIMAPFNWLSEGAERTIGLGSQIADDGFTEVLDDLPAAWQASQATYEASQNEVLNLMARIGNDQPSGEGEVWDLASGNPNPVDIEHTIGTDSDAEGAQWLEVGREWISSGQAQDEFTTATNGGTFNGTYQEYVAIRLSADFKFSGVMNDLVYQTIIDPLNVLPFVTGKVGGKVATALGNERLGTALTQGAGNILIDALPPGIQQLTEFVTKKPSSKGLMQSVNMYKDWVRTGFYPAKLLDMPDDMRVQYNRLVNTGVKPEQIKIEDNFIKWKDNTGAEQVFTGSKSVKIPSVEELSSFEKYIGGIDETYGLKELRPTTNKTFLQKLNKLTPAAQVNVMMNIFHNNISTLMDASGGDPTKMVDFFQKIAGKKEINHGDIGEAIMKSPSNRAIQAAVQWAIKDGDMSDTMLASWVEGGERRTILNKVAQALDEKPADVLQQLSDAPEVMAKRLNDIAPELKTTPEFLTETLKVFTGDDPMPWSAEQFQTELVTTFANKMDKYFQEKYGLAPEHWVFRVSNALKGVQSLALLGFNPAYFMNNWVNNLVTRAVDGVGGYMTSKQISEFDKRLGIFPKDAGLSGFDDITGNIIHNAQQVTDGISKVQTGVSFLNKAGIFTRLSGKIERLEGTQARTAGIKQFLDKTKRVDVGIRRMSPIVESLLDAKYPGLKEKIYGAINAGMNMDEIEAGIFSNDVMPHIENVIDEIDKKYTPNTPGVTRDLLNRTGLLDRLHDNLKDAKSTDDVDTAFSKVESDFQDYLEAQHQKSLVNRAEEVKNVVQSERIPAVLQLFGDQIIENAQSWINGRKEWETLYARKADGQFTDKQWRKEVRALDAKQQSEMRRMNEYQLQTHKGIVEALGIESEFTRGFINRMVDLNQNWKDFWTKRTQLYKEYFQRVENMEPVTWNDLQEKLTELYDKATNNEKNIQNELDRLFAKGYADFTGWDANKAAAWRKQLYDMRYAIIEAQKQMRERTANMMPYERDAEYEKFNPIYNKMIVDMKKLEHDGAFSLMNKPAPEATINVPDIEIPINPEISPYMIAKMHEIGYDDEQISQLRPEQMNEAINQYNLQHPVKKVIEIVKTKIVADDIIAEADQQKRNAILHENGMLARADIEDQLRAAFPNSNYLEIQAVMTLMDMHADTVARRNGVDPSDATRDSWYGTHIDSINGSGETAVNQLNQSIQNENATWYYSQLAKTLETMPNKITPDALRRFLNGKVKSDELQFTGFDKWLSEQSGQITKQDALDFIQENQIKVEEVVHGEPTQSTLFWVDGRNGWGYNSGISFASREEAIDAAKKTFGSSDVEAEELVNSSQINNPNDIQPLYSKYSLPGEKNYRELLLTLPEKPTGDNKWQLMFPDGQKFYTPFNTEAEARVAIAEAFPGRTDITAVQIKEPAMEASYKSGHWTEKNVLAHLRFDERIDADGKKVLFIEEIQSDWHQEGREKGYQHPVDTKGWTIDDQPYKANIENNLTDLLGINNLPSDNLNLSYRIFDQEGKWIGTSRLSGKEGINEVAYTQSKIGVPLAPFSKNWDELAVKRAIRYAAENGYDRVAWTTGKMQADRYNLSNYVDEIGWVKDSQTGSVSLDLIKDGNFISNRKIARKDLPETIGVEATKKITEDTRNMGTLRGDDLAVGGHGMHGFYDEKIPAIVQKYIKKWGGKVGETFFTKNRLDLTNGMVDGYTVPSFDITPEMRKSVMEQGQPLFDTDKGSVQWLNNGRAVIRAFESADLSTMVHEIGHIFRRDLSDADLDVVAKLGGLSGGSEMRLLETQFQNGTLKQGMPEFSRYIQAEEQFARGWERYLTEGDAPTPELRSVFRKFTDWMLNIYQNIFKKNGRVQGFEGTQLGINIDATVNGISLRDVFDRLLVDRPDRPLSYSDLVKQRAGDIKKTGRNFRFSDEDLTAKARTEIAKEILENFESVDAARIATEFMDDYIILPDGSKVDDVTIFDALADIQEHPEADPWRISASKKVDGLKSVAFTPKGNKIQTRYAVVDLDTLENSDIWQGNTVVPNPKYNQKLQGRSRNEKSSIAWMMDKAKPDVFDPELILEEFKATDRGTPIIADRNQIWSGNGRVNAIRYGIIQDLGTYEKYRGMLDDAAIRVGIDPDEYADMQHPILVREVIDNLSPEQLADLAADTNKASSASMSDFEIAINDGQRITDEALRSLEVGDNESIEGAILAARNQPFVTQFLTGFDREALGEISSNLKLTAKGVTRIMNALLSKVYKGASGERLVRIIANGDNSLVARNLKVLKDTLPQVAVLEGKIATGMLNENLKISDDLSVAIDVLDRIRQNKNISVNEYLNTSTLVRETTPFQDTLIQFLDEAKPTEARATIRAYCETAALEPDPRQMDMFGGAPTHTKEEIFNVARTAGSINGNKIEETTTSQITQAAPQLSEQPINTGTGEGTGGLQPGSEPVQPGNGQETSARELTSEFQTENDPGLITRAIKTSEAITDFNNGDMVPLDSLSDVTLTHNDILPVPGEVQALIDQAETYRFDNKQKARDYVQWILNGEKGEKPSISQLIIDDYADSLDILRNYAMNKSKGIPTHAPAGGINGELQKTTNTLVQKVYKFNHGDTPCVANVYKDGRLVAYLPETPLPDTKISDTSRVLGLDPQDPNLWVYEIDGEIKSVDMMKPEVDDLGPQSIEETTMQPAETTLPVESTPDTTATGPQRLMLFGEDDVSYSRALKAYNWSSFDPERRARGEQRDYVRHMNEVLDEFSPYATTPEKQTQLIGMMENYKVGYLKKLNAFLDAKSRTASSNITGPSNFPVQKNRERMEIADRRWRELVEWDEKVQKKIKKEIAPEISRVISSDNPEAIKLLETKLKTEEDRHKLMMASNKVISKQSLTEAEKIVELTKLGLSEEDAKKALTPDYLGRLGFPSYELTNSNVQIRDIKDRIAKLETSRATPGSEMVFEGGKIVDNAEENRIQIFFDTKPDAAMREKLKANGFRFAPSQNNAWQRFRNNATRNVIERLFPDAHAVGDISPVEGGDFIKPTFTEEQPGGELNQKGQGNLFSQSAEDLPLFSGTAPRAQDELFTPQAESGQMSMFGDLVPEAKPTRIIEIAVKENGATYYVRIDLKKTSVIRQTLELHKGETMTARILDTNGKVIASDLNPNDVVNPSFGSQLFQTANTNKPISDMNLDELRYALSHDELTGIKNRRAYNSAKKMQVQVVLDVEGLKYINDNLGHPVGDDVLRALANSIKEVAPDEAYRGSDRADEFIMQFNTENEASTAVRRIQETLADQRIKAGDQEWSGFGASYGIGSTLSEADAALNKNKIVDISEGRRANRGEKPVNLKPVEPNPDAPMGHVPLNGTPVLDPYARTLNEVNSEMIRPMLQDLRQSYKVHMGDQKVKWADVTQTERDEIKKYLKGTVTNDLASTKLAAVNYGDSMRNGALLDYSRRYGIDSVLGLVYPYQFWYTRSMINWAKRMVDKPAWFAMYTRYLQTQSKMERDGMPTRLKGKVRIDMPWMPEWMGGGLWVDPVSKIFPFDQFGQPLEQYSMNKNQVDKRAEQIVNDMLDGEKITTDEAGAALKTKTGSVWSRAVSQAELELDKSASPTSMASMMMRPALWWSIPSNIIGGTPEKISTMPITRTGQTIRDLGSDTFIEPITNTLGGALAGPEELIRKKAGLSEFGQWGDYYLDRTLAGMAADGEITADQARMAMIQRSGAEYQEAYNRVVREQSLKTPGAAGIVALKEKANPAQVLDATLNGIFGGSIFSEGELKMRGLKPIYDNARKKLAAGDAEAMNKFYDDYPEYAARLALYDKPEERLHQFLVDSIWKRYMELDPINRKLATEALGEDFQNSFLNKETRSYEALDDKTLASWAQMLGSALPKTNELKDVQKITAPQYYNQETVDAVNVFKAERSKKYPSYSAWQEAYYALPVGAQRKAFLKQHPQLKTYWTWKDNYAKQHPEIQQYFEDQKDATSTETGSTSSGITGYSAQTIKLTQQATKIVIQAFKDARNANFPNYKQYQDEYYAQKSKTDRESYLAQTPQLQAYWDWKDQYAIEHPEIQPYYDQLRNYARQQTDTQTSAIQSQFSSELTAPLIRALLAYSTGSALSSGAKSELDRIRKEIAPELTDDQFLQEVLGTVVK